VRPLRAHGRTRDHLLRGLHLGRRRRTLQHPFLTVNDPAAVAASYDTGKGFAVAVIGRDGNLDCLSTRPLPGQRILDLVNNNASVQEQMRR